MHNKRTKPNQTKPYIPATDLLFISSLNEHQRSIYAELTELQTEIRFGYVKRNRKPNVEPYLKFLKLFIFAERSRRLHGEGACFSSKVLDGVESYE